MHIHMSACAQLCSVQHMHLGKRTASKHPYQCAVVCRYILPSLSLVPSDHEESVKVQYALVLAQLAAAANRFLLHLQQLANRQLQPDPSSPTLVRPPHCLWPHPVDQLCSEAQDWCKIAYMHCRA